MVARDRERGEQTLSRLRELAEMPSARLDGRSVPGAPVATGKEARRWAVTGAAHLRRRGPQLGDLYYSPL
jgi:hypothetical protein